MIYPVLFPEMGEDEEKATLVKWLVQVGDSVEEGQEILELLSDKATFTVESPADGILKKILVPEGSEIKTGDQLGEVESSS